MYCTQEAAIWFQIGEEISKNGSLVFQFITLTSNELVNALLGSAYRLTKYNQAFGTFIQYVHIVYQPDCCTSVQLTILSKLLILSGEL